MQDGSFTEAQNLFTEADALKERALLPTLTILARLYEKVCACMGVCVCVWSCLPCEGVCVCVCACVCLSCYPLARSHFCLSLSPSLPLSLSISSISFSLFPSLSLIS